MSVAIPFRVGWGFQRGFQLRVWELGLLVSQSLSGWGGVFNNGEVYAVGVVTKSQSLSGWGGVFNVTVLGKGQRIGPPVAIPFRVGWGTKAVTSDG